MNLNPTLRIPSKKTAFLIILLLAVLGVVGYAVWDFDLFSKPWYARWQIQRYLKKQTGRKDFKCDFKFNLAEDVSKLQNNISLLDSNASQIQTNLTRLYKEVIALNKLAVLQAEANRKQHLLTNRLRELSQTLTNIPDALTNFPPAVLTNVEAMQKEAVALKTVVEPVSLPLQPLRDEIAALSKTQDEKLHAMQPQRRELAALQRQLTGGRKQDPKTNEVALTAEELTTISNKVEELKTALAPAQAEYAELTRQITAKQNELNEKLKDVAAQLRTLRVLTNRIEAVTDLQPAIARLQVDVIGVQQDLESRAKDAGLPRESLADRQKTVAAKQKEQAELRKKYDPLLTEIAAKRKELFSKRNLLDAQQNDFSAQFRKKYDETKTYGQMYVLLGQQIWVATQLLNHPDPTQKRVGLAIALDAAKSSASIIENYWLAAKICEGFVMPNLELADDPKRKVALNPDTLMQQCIFYFREASETNQVIDILQWAVKSAKTPRASDYARYTLAREYEQNAQYANALATYRAIKDTNNFKWVTQRIQWLEQRVKRKK